MEKGLLFLGLAAIAGGGYWWWSKNKTSSLIPITSSASSTSSTSTSAAKTVNPVTSSWGLGNDNFPLRLYSFGDQVKTLQKALNKKGASLVVDGKFGSGTKSAVQKYIGTTQVSASQYSVLMYSSGLYYNSGYGF